MKKLSILLLAGMFTWAACKRDTLTTPGNQPGNNTVNTAKGSGGGGDEDPTDASYCRCNPCNTNVSWNNADVELTPKMICCTQACNGSLSQISYFENYNISHWIDSTTQPAALIPLAEQADILQRACSTATANRPAGKIIVSVEILRRYIGFSPTYYGLYIKATYARCNSILPQDQDRAAPKQ